MEIFNSTIVADRRRSATIIVYLRVTIVDINVPIVDGRRGIDFFVKSSTIDIRSSIPISPTRGGFSGGNISGSGLSHIAYDVYFYDV